MQSWHRGRKIPKAALPMIYIVIFAVLIALAVMGDAHEKDAVYGAANERFDSNITVEYEGTTYRYCGMNITNYLWIGVNDAQITDGNSQDDAQVVLIVLLSADKINQTITPIIVDPDTVITITDDENISGKKRIRIGQARALPGEDMTGSDDTVLALSQLFYGVPIDHSIAVDIDGVSILNDAIGGVLITLEDDLTELDSELVQGTTVSLNGQQIKKFLCGQINPADGAGVSRTELQKVYLDHLRAKLLEHTDGKLYLLKELSKLDGYYVTDLRGGELLSALRRYENYEWKESIDLPGEYHSGEDEAQEFWLNESKTWEILKDLWFKEEHTDKVAGSDE